MEQELEQTQNEPAPEGEPKHEGTALTREPPAEPVSKVPDKYEFNLPEGFDPDTEMLEKFAPLAKELGLPQEQAQKLVDLHSSTIQKMNKAQMDEWGKVQQEWIEKARSDEEYGGQGFEENVGVARKALDTFGTDELKEALDSSGLGNHPEVLRFFHRVGKAIREDTMHASKKGSDQPRSHAQTLFPNMN